MHFTPLIYDNLDYAWSFSAELSPEGLIGIAGSVLRFVSLTSIALSYLGKLEGYSRSLDWEQS
jgi:hypothetical protein